MGLTLQEGIAGVSHPTQSQRKLPDKYVWSAMLLGMKRNDYFIMQIFSSFPPIQKILDSSCRGAVTWVPVIASRGNPWARLEEMGCGLCISNDQKSLAAAIERMKHSPLLEMGKNGRAWMMKEFDWELL